MIRILIILLLFACSEEHIETEIDSGLQPYFDDLRNEAIKRNKSINPDSIEFVLKFADFEGNHNGFASNNGVMFIDEEYFINASDSDRMGLLCMEVGHTLLKLKHNEKGVRLMLSPSTYLTRKAFKENPSEHYDELFKN